MVKVSGPAMSMDASGKLGGALVFSKWKGRPYVRSLVTPANPKSAKQLSVRAMMKFLSQGWSSVSAADQATWATIADNLKVSNFNAYQRGGMKRWASFKAPSSDTPATEDGTLPSGGSITPTGGVGEVTVEYSNMSGGDGWGVMIFRSTTSGFTPGFSNLVQVLDCPDGASVEWIDTPLDADTYYYNAIEFDDTGQKATALGEQSATVT